MMRSEFGGGKRINRSALTTDPTCIAFKLDVRVPARTCDPDDGPELGRRTVGNQSSDEWS